eukprot:891384-Prymnesium_polylepis.2
MCATADSTTPSHRGTICAHEHKTWPTESTLPQTAHMRTCSQGKLGSCRPCPLLIHIRTLWCVANAAICSVTQHNTHLERQTQHFGGQQCGVRAHGPKVWATCEGMWLSWSSRDGSALHLNQQALDSPDDMQQCATSAKCAALQPIRQ